MASGTMKRDEFSRYVAQYYITPSASLSRTTNSAACWLFLGLSNNQAVIMTLGNNATYVVAGSLPSDVTVTMSGYTVTITNHKTWNIRALFILAYPDD